LKNGFYKLLFCVCDRGRFLKGAIGSFARGKGSTGLCQQLVEP